MEERKTGVSFVEITSHPLLKALFGMLEDEMPEALNRATEEAAYEAVSEFRKIVSMPVDGVRNKISQVVVEACGRAGCPQCHLARRALLDFIQVIEDVQHAFGERLDVIGNNYVSERDALRSRGHGHPNKNATEARRSATEARAASDDTVRAQPDPSERQPSDLS